MKYRLMLVEWCHDGMEVVLKKKKEKNKEIEK